MHETLLVHCRHCGAEFVTENPRCLYCCTRCRRSFQDVRRQRERAEAARAKEKPVRIPVARATCPFLFAYGDEYQDCAGCMECFRGEEQAKQDGTGPEARRSAENVPQCL